MFYAKVRAKSCAELGTFFLVGFPIQNVNETLAFADHERSEVGGRTDY